MRVSIIGMLAAVTLLASIPAFSQRPKSAPQSAALPPGFDAYVDKVLKTFQVPGLFVSIVKDGKVVLAKGYGVRQLGDPKPVDEHTLFLIASNSKAFTATALAILVEEGKLKWDDPVINYLPWFRMADPYVSTHMTVRDLLVHRSGIQAYAGDLMLFPPSRYTRKELLEKLPRIPLTHDFRTTYAYDNILYLAAGEIIQAVSGMDWEDFVRTHIFNKLDMSETISRFSRLSQEDNVAMAHGVIGGKVVTFPQFQQTAIGDASDPAGGICTNATDMAKWLITQLDSGMAPNKTRIFQPSTTRELWKIVTPIPVQKVPDYLKPAQMSFWGYALGFRTFNYGAYQVVGHGGKLDGFVSQVSMVPSLRLGIAVMTNQENSGAYWAIINQLFDHYMQNPAFDWIAGYKRQDDSAAARLRVAQTKHVFSRNVDAKASLPDSLYAGVYRDALYGDASIRMEKEEKPGSMPHLVLRFSKSPILVADLQHFQHDTYIARFRTVSLKADAYVSFALKPDATVDQFKMSGIDPDSDLGFDDLLFRPVPLTEYKHTAHKTTALDTAGLRKDLLNEFAKLPEGTFGIAVKDLSNDATFFMNEKTVFHAASTMKTAVMIEAFRQSEIGTFKLSDSVVIHTNFKSIVDGSVYTIDSSVDSEMDLYRRVGTKTTIYELIYKMITRSSNLATNMMIELVGAPNVNTTMRSIGAMDIQVLRGVEDQKAFKAGLNNTTTPFDLMTIMQHIAEGQVVTKAACEGMLKILFDQYWRSIIPAKLPSDVRVANKTGSIAAVRHDSGIVYLPDGRKYVVVLMSRGVEDEDLSTATLAQASKIIYDHIIDAH